MRALLLGLSLSLTACTLITHLEDFHAAPQENEVDASTDGVSTLLRDGFVDGDSGRALADSGREDSGRSTRTDAALHSADGGNPISADSGISSDSGNLGTGDGGASGADSGSEDASGFLRDGGPACSPETGTRCLGPIGPCGYGIRQCDGRCICDDPMCGC